MKRSELVTYCALSLIGSGICPISQTVALALQPIARRLAMTEAMSVPRPRQVHQRHPMVAHGEGVYLLVWHEGFEGADGSSDILALRIGPDGNPLDREPAVVCKAQSVQDHAVVAWCADKFLVVWSDLRNGRDYDLYGAVVTPAGLVTPRDGFLLAGGPGTQAYPAITSNGKDEFLVVWQQFAENHFEIYAKRLVAANPQAEATAFRIMNRGEHPAVAWNGTNYAVCQKWYTTVVTPAGQNVVETFQVWKSKTVAWPTAAAAWGRSFFFMNTEPYPDPWGWGGNGTMIGVSIDAEGRSPELELAARFSDLQAAEADGRVKNCLDAAQWRNHPGWPMGMRGGLKGTHDGMWPNGKVAAAFNCYSLLCVWSRAHLVDNRRLANRDLYLTRILPDWAFVERPPVRIVAGSTEETNPVLCAGGAGQCLLAYEKVVPTGVTIEYRMLAEEEDRDPPKVVYVVPQSDTEWVVAFDEPIEAESASRSENFRIEDIPIRAAAFNTDIRGWQREVVLTTGAPLGRDKAYVLHVSGVRDRSPRGNSATDQVVQFLAAPGSMLRGAFIDRWLVLGPFPRDPLQHPFAVSEARPATSTRVGTCEWTAVSTAVLDFGRRFGEDGNAMVYAAVWSFSAKPRKAQLWLDTNDHNRCWVNGQMVHDGITKATSSRGFHDYRDEIPVELKKGWNLLIVQVENRSGAWLMTAQLVDEQGVPLRDITWQADAPLE